jgi:hypothetical protein
VAYEDNTRATPISAGCKRIKSTVIETQASF